MHSNGGSQHLLMQFDLKVFCQRQKIGSGTIIIVDLEIGRHPLIYKIFHNSNKTMEIIFHRKAIPTLSGQIPSLIYFYL